MSDDFNENDVATDTGEAQASEVPEIPQAILDKYDEIFGGKDASVNAELGDTAANGAASTEPVKSTAEIEASKAANRQSKRQAAKEQQDELVEEGLESEDAAVQDKPETKEAPVAKTAEAPAEKKEAVDKSKVELDSSLRFAANELGWADDKIDKLLAADPVLAMETFNALATTYTNLSRQFLNNPAPLVAPGTPGHVEQPAQQVVPTPNLDKLYADLHTFAETNGEDLVEKFLKPLQAEIITPLKALLAENAVTKQRVAEQEIRQSFDTVTGKFSQFYGTDGKRTAEEQQTVARLAQVADQIRTGARVQGREMSVKDALNQAHMIVTADKRDAIVRSAITEQVQRRTKTTTAKPTQRRTPGAGVQKSHVAAAEAIERFYAERGISAGDDDLE